MYHFPGEIMYIVKCDKVIRTCRACRKTFKNEPYAIQWKHASHTKAVRTVRCWRCWHTDEVTQLFLNKYGTLFNRCKQGPWYYLSLQTDQFHFPSTDGDFDPDW